MSSQEQKEKEEKQVTEEPRANNNEDDGQGTTSNPNTAETNTEQKSEDIGTDNGIVQSTASPLTEVQVETQISNDETTPSEECNTKNSKELLVEIRKMHSLICGKNESQRDDSIILVQETQRVFLEMLDKIKKCVEMPDQFTWDTEKKQIANEKLAPRTDEAVSETTRMETLHCFLDQKRGEMKKIREQEEKIQIELKKFEQVQAERTSLYQSLQERIQKQQQPAFDIPEDLPEEEKQVLNKLKNDLERKADEVKQLKKEQKELYKTKEKELRDLEKEKESQHQKGRGGPKLKAMEKEKEMLIERKDEEINTLKKDMEDQHRRGEQKLKAMEKEIGELRQSGEQKLDAMEKENGKLRQRLSKVAGAKLTDGNPSFTDLNDPNRPTKLAERYRELNDNEWTNAFEILTEEKKIKKRNAIKLLRNIVTDCYQECVRLAEEQWKTLARVLTKTRTENVDVDETLKKIGFRQTEFKDLKNLRKMAATKASDGVIEKVKEDVLLERLENDEQMMQQLRPFLEESIRLTWSMAVQDPPVYMFWDLKQGDPPNDMFKVYTKDGNKVRFIVWPSLLLHEGGPLLVKGVYQLYTE